MGNQHSSSSTSGDRGRPFGRGNALGLSRSELDKRCQPSGLYKNCAWEVKAIRRLIGDGKLAALAKGQDQRTPDCSAECPICFLYYSQANVTKCCNANICTECFLQVRPQKEKNAACPFCNHSKLSVMVKVGEDNEEETDDPPLKSSADDGSDGKLSSSPATTEGSFGSSLEQNEFVARMRKRSESLASSSEGGAVEETIANLAMTAEERRALEQQMQAQIHHPLALQVQAEAYERQLENERNYRRSNSGNTTSSRSRRSRRNRDWNSIVENFERSNGRQIQSLDDLVVLEAAILLSMNEEERQRQLGSTGSSSAEGFDAAQHARDGFPLVQNFLERGGMSREERLEQLSQILNSSSSSSRRGRRSREQLLSLRAGRRPAGRESTNATLDTASLLMRGVSEEEQIAMAIAASLQEQGPSSEAAQTSESNEGAENADAEGGAAHVEDGEVAITTDEADSDDLENSILADTEEEDDLGEAQNTDADDDANLNVAGEAAASTSILDDSEQVNPEPVCEASDDGGANGADAEEVSPLVESTTVPGPVEAESTEEASVLVDAARIAQDEPTGEPEAEIEGSAFKNAEIPPATLPEDVVDVTHGRTEESAT